MTESKCIPGPESSAPRTHNPPPTTQNPAPRTQHPVPSTLPAPEGLYDPRHEHDACGIGFVASIKGHKSHDIIAKGIQVLINLTHRGACGCDPETGDGAGILIQIPHKFFARECATLGFTLPAEGEYGVGMTFLPVEPHQRLSCEGILERIVREEGLTVLGWRDTPVDGDAIGRVARASQPYIQQIFIGNPSTQDPAPSDPERSSLLSVSSTSSANAPKPKSPAPTCPTRATSTSPRFPPAPSFTKASCSPHRWPTSTASSPTPM